MSSPVHRCLHVGCCIILVHLKCTVNLDTGLKIFLQFILFYSLILVLVFFCFILVHQSFVTLALLKPQKMGIIAWLKFYVQIQYCPLKLVEQWDFRFLANMLGQFRNYFLSFEMGSFQPMWLYDSIYDKSLRGRSENIVDPYQLASDLDLFFFF